MNSKNRNRTISQLSKNYTTEDEIAIIGGGASGLTSAFFLIEAGHNPEKISIYEKNNYLGGHARTVYLHQVSNKELYAIQDYEIEFENNYKDVFLQYIDHNKTEQRLKVNDNQDVFPVDIGVCGFSKNYHNFKNILSNLKNKKGIPFFEYSYLEEVSRSINLDNLILRSDKCLYGQLFRPWNWLRLFRLKKDVKKIVAYCEKKGLSYLQSITTKTLLDELRKQSISKDALDLMCAFCQVGSGYSHEKFSEISANYLYSFFMLGNFNNAGENNTIFNYGVSVYLHKLISHLKNQGVQFKKTREHSSDHTIYAIQPYEAQKLNKDLPSFESTRSILYVHCDQFFQGKMETGLSYGKVNNLALATWDIDRMRPNHPKDIGAFITFTIPDHETEIDNKLYKGNKVQYLSETLDNSHNLYDAPLKKLWQHAFIDVAAETKRKDVWQNHQGKDNSYYCSSSYLYCMLHENAITSALDVVCMLTGAHEKLSKLGFEASDFTLEVYGV